MTAGPHFAFQLVFHFRLVSLSPIHIQIQCTGTGPFYIFLGRCWSLLGIHLKSNFVDFQGPDKIISYCYCEKVIAVYDDIKSYDVLHNSASYCWFRLPICFNSLTISFDKQSQICSFYMYLTDNIEEKLCPNWTILASLDAPNDVASDSLDTKATSNKSQETKQQKTTKSGPSRTCDFPDPWRLAPDRPKTKS